MWISAKAERPLSGRKPKVGVKEPPNKGAPAPIKRGKKRKGVSPLTKWK